MAGQPQSDADSSFRLSYGRKWKAYALRRNLALSLLYGCIPVCCVLYVVLGVWLHQPLLSTALGLAWLVALLAALWWAGDFRCPRCKRRFAALGRGDKWLDLSWGLFDKTCSNCTLARFEVPAR